MRLVLILKVWIIIKKYILSNFNSDYNHNRLWIWRMAQCAQGRDRKELRVFNTELRSKTHSLDTYPPPTTEPHSNNHSKGVKIPQAHSKCFKFRMRTSLCHLEHCFTCSILSPTNLKQGLKHSLYPCGVSSKCNPLMHVLNDLSSEHAASNR